MLPEISKKGIGESGLITQVGKPQQFVSPLNLNELNNTGYFEMPDNDLNEDEIDENMILCSGEKVNKNNLSKNRRLINNESKRSTKLQQN